MPQSKLDPGLLEAALIGYRRMREEMDQKIAELRRRIGGRPLVSEMSTEQVAAAPARRQMSPAARRRIAEAQKKRWDAFRKAKASATKAPRRMARKTVRRPAPAAKAAEAAAGTGAAVESQPAS